MIITEHKDVDYYIERLWVLINKEGLTKEEADKSLRTEIINFIKSEKLYKEFYKYLEPLEKAIKIIHWQYWTHKFDPPKKKEELTYNLNVSGIYEIVNIRNNKRYIGLSKNIKDRWKSHVRYLNLKMHHCENLQREWIEYGSEYFKFNVIQEIQNLDLLGFYERYWWQNTIGDKYNNDSHMITAKDYKIIQLEMKIKTLEKQLSQFM